MPSIHEQQEAQPRLCKNFNAQRAQSLYAEAVKLIRKKRLYRDPSFTANSLAKHLNTNTRYIAATMAIMTGSNFCALMNSFRLEAAVSMLRSEKHKHFTVEEIALHAGFSSRQVFYRVFQNLYHCTPREYRLFTTDELTKLLQDLNQPE